MILNPLAIVRITAKWFSRWKSQSGKKSRTRWIHSIQVIKPEWIMYSVRNTEYYYEPILRVCVRDRDSGFPLGVIANSLTTSLSIEKIQGESKSTCRWGLGTDPGTRASLGDCYPNIITHQIKNVKERKSESIKCTVTWWTLVRAIVKSSIVL